MSQKKPENVIKWGRKSVSQWNICLLTDGHISKKSLLMLTCHSGSDMQQEAICLSFHWRATTFEQEMRDINSKGCNSSSWLESWKSNFIHVYVINFTQQMLIILFQFAFRQFLPGEINHCNTQWITINYRRSENNKPLKCGANSPVQLSSLCLC